MNIQVKTDLGGTTFTFDIDEKDEIEALHKAAVLGNMPKYCHLCKNSNYFKLDSNKDKEGNTYINIVCKQCTAKAKLGRYKVGGFFWRAFEMYKKEDLTE